MMKNARRGFTFAEVLVVVMIIVMMSVVLLIYPPSYWGGGASNSPNVGNANTHGNVDDRHLETVGVLFADGHVKARKYDSLVGPADKPDLFWYPGY